MTTQPPPNLRPQYGFIKVQFLDDEPALASEQPCKKPKAERRLVVLGDYGVVAIAPREHGKPIRNRTRQQFPRKPCALELFGYVGTALGS